MACSKHTPSEAADRYYDALRSENYDEVLQMMHFARPDESIRTELIDYLREQNTKQIQLNGGISKSAVIRQTISSDGKSAEVVSAITYKNNEEGEQTLKFISVDGQWLLDVR